MEGRPFDNDAFDTNSILKVKYLTCEKKVYHKCDFNPRGKSTIFTRLLLPVFESTIS